MIVLLNEVRRDLSRHRAVGPGGVGEYDGKEDERHIEHDLKRQLRTRAVPDGEARTHFRGTRQDEGEHRDERRENDRQHGRCRHDDRKKRFQKAREEYRSY